MFKINNRNSRTRFEICSKLTIKTPEWRQWRRSGVFIETYFTPCSSVSIVKFEHGNADWDYLDVLQWIQTSEGFEYKVIN